MRLVTGSSTKATARRYHHHRHQQVRSSCARQKIKDEGINIFVLVDESHRSQYGSMHAKMAQVFPNACYIGFTGTPLTKAEKSTAAKFGSFIHNYPMRQAVDDRAVVPLLYEGRIVEQSTWTKSSWSAGSSAPPAT